MQAYMKNHFEFFGIKSPDRKEVFKAFIQEFKLPDDQEFENVIKTLWNHPMREAQYCAQELVDRKKWFKRESSIDLIEWMITKKAGGTVSILSQRIFAEAISGSFRNA